MIRSKLNIRKLYFDGREFKNFIKKNRRRCAELVMAFFMLAMVYVFAGKIPALQASSDRVDTLSAKKVVIDPGHGGVDGGAVSVLGDSEKDINLSIALKLREKLKEKGVEVIMTREEDAGLYKETDTNKKNADMKARCRIINDSSPDLMVSIHQNNYSTHGVKGAQVFYYAHSKEGERAAALLQEQLVEALDKNNKRKAKANTSYYILLNVKCPAVIAECGFLSNYEEAELLMSEAYQEKVAEALCEGICKYLENQNQP